MERDLPLAVTMGEPAGIGGEVLLSAWQALRDGPAKPVDDPGPFFAIDDLGRLQTLAQGLGWKVPMQKVARAQEAAACFTEALPVLHRPLPAAVQPGRPDPRNAAAVLAAIEEAVALCGAGAAAALVTSPIAKKVLYDAGFAHPGHTEFLGELAEKSGGPARPVMMLACPALRVVPITVHIPLAEVPKRLSGPLIVETAKILDRALRRDFAVKKPRLALAGLNPHAGEGGSIGREEIEIMAPALAQLRAQGLQISGPLAADSLFHEEARTSYDTVLCPTHDQALIPIKTLDFAGAVNITLGLPFIRTSPDHGTAFDIAGQGKADARSFLNALRAARAMAIARSTYDKAHIANNRASRQSP